MHVPREWAEMVFHCVKLHCPGASLACLFDYDCRRLVRALALNDPCPGGRAATMRTVCGDECSVAARALLACLDGDGAGCVYATGGLPAVHRRAALSEAELATLMRISAAAEAVHGKTYRTFGAADGTTGHEVTWLTPDIYAEAALLRRLRQLAIGAAAEGGWELDEPDALRLRCAEHLSYQGGNVSQGLGWHWDLGSVLTMVVMVHSSDAEDGAAASDLPPPGRAAHARARLSCTCAVHVTCTCHILRTHVACTCHIHTAGRPAPRTSCAPRSAPGL